MSLLNAVKCRSIYYKLKGILKSNFSYVLFIYKSQNKRVKLKENKCLNIFSKMNLNYHKMENEQVSLLQITFIIYYLFIIFLSLIIYKYITLKLSLYKYVGEQID